MDIGAVLTGAQLVAEAVKNAPNVVRESKALYEAVRKGNRLPAGTVEEMKEKLAALQSVDEQQAELIGKLAAENEALSRSVAILAGRMTVMLALTLVAVLIAVVALGIAVVG
jgi:hypothetical protein